MDTVRVDIQKLQLLNDRIAQTIDALNQVRMTTHGLQHTAPSMAGGQASAFPQHTAPSMAGGQASAFTLHTAPSMAGGQASAFPQHTAPSMAGGQASAFPQGISPFQQQSFSGYAASPFASPYGVTAPQIPGAVAGFQGMPGISHSAALDPQWQARIAQTFPYVSSPQPVAVI